MDTDILSKFEFLLGDWKLEYHIPESSLSEPGTDTGSGTFKKILNDKYIQFEYSTESGSEAKGIFARDEKINALKYYWFENSGSFLSATCNFIDNNTLAMNWHNTLLVQTFKQEGANRVVLRMKYPSPLGGYDLVLEVIFTRWPEII
jgi:hypothetical protein